MEKKGGKGAEKWRRIRTSSDKEKGKICKGEEGKKREESKRKAERGG
jgi:hypothetical protein